MIEGVLDDLASELETAEVHEIEEKEGSSSTMGKNDNEGEDVDDENQVKNSLEAHNKQQVMIQDEEQAPILVEESVPDGDHREEIISTMAEMKSKSSHHQFQHNELLHL